MKTIQLLSVGNSFSQDAQRYLHAIADRWGFDLHCTNLVIGGCSLERHYRNSLSGQRAYYLEVNGAPTGFTVSLEEALAANPYDFVTFQQASHFSFLPETYEPYLTRLAQTVRTYQPAAKLAIHATWAYAAQSDRLHEMGFDTPEQMCRAVNAAYQAAAGAVEADLVLPSGNAMLKLAQRLGSVHRDPIHASLGVGRYTLGLVWAGMLLGVDPAADTFDRLDVPTDEAALTCARQAAAEAVRERRAACEAGRPFDLG